MNTQETFRQAAEARKRKKEEKKDRKSPKAQNMTMEEALRWATEKTPNSPIASAIKAVEQAREPERIKQKDEEEFTQLKEQFKEVGLLWFGTRIDQSIGRSRGYDRIPIDQKKKQWLQALATLKDKPSEKRIELLKELASGMHLIEDIAPADNSKYGRMFLVAPLVYRKSELLGISFTRPSIFFMESINDMSGHSREQQEEFRDFMIKKSGLTGRVEMPQLFPVISRWIGLGSDTSNAQK